MAGTSESAVEGAGVTLSDRPHVSAMTVDVEDYYHAHALERHFPRAGWDALEKRVEFNTNELLDLFDTHGVKGTFFTLGAVARDHPALIRDIVGRGHELASHGYSHFRASEQDRPTFVEDIRAAKSALEDAGGVEVTGYRAASFSIGTENWWAFDALAEAGYNYSSSLSNGRLDRVDMAIPDHPFHPSSAGVLEMPITTLDFAGIRIPTGGGFFRLLPYKAFKPLLSRLDRPCMFYFHPWEIDANQPRAATTWKTRVRHYGNLSTMKKKIDHLLGDFQWGRISDAFPRKESSSDDSTA